MPTRTIADRLLARARALCSAGRIALAGMTGARIGCGCVVDAGCDIQLGFAPQRRGQLRMGENCRLGSGVILHPYSGSILLGSNVFIGPYVVIYGHGGVDIGDDCLIAMHCRILSSEHALAPVGTPILSQPDSLKPTRLGRDVWLGAGVTILGGITIGDGCVVGAGAVVTHDLPPYSIAHGVPARIVGKRPCSA